MAPARNEPDSATTRRVALRVRPDLAMRPQQIGRHRYWIVKDPVALSYFHLREEEHAILQMLDGRTSLAEIKRRFEQTFAPLQISIQRLHAFLGRLHRCGLLLSEAPGQGDQLRLRAGQRRRLAVVQALTGILAIRSRGVDPEPLLRWLYPKCRWLFSWWVLLACFALALAAATLVAVRFDAWQSKLPDFYAFFNARSLLGLAAALALAKVLHELGHALTCKHFGGECHEVGVMLLVFTPCLYCNVSDSWMLSNKWQRIAISAAGICVEIFLASVCTFLWWFSEPGLLNTFCLDMIFVCSVSTILFNGNPLLRYDGYFILSDLVEVPNLGQQSRALVGRVLARFFLGIELHDDRALPETHRGLLALYGVAAALYRWAVVIAILWFCHRVLESYRLELVARVMAVVVIAGLLMSPLWNLSRALGNPAWRRRVKRGRAVLRGGALVAVLAAIVVVPLPLRLTAPVVLQPRDVHRVYVSVPGTLRESVPAGAEVGRGQPLARLEDLDLQGQVEELAGQRNLQRLRLKHLEFRLAQDPGAGLPIPAAREALADVEERLRQRRQDQGRLVLTAPAGGTVLPPPRQWPPPSIPGRLATWWGNPQETRNLGCHLKTGTLYCLVADPSRLEAVLVIDQADVQFVRVGQRVRIKLDELPGEILGGRITDVAKTDLEVAPREFAGRGDLLTRVDKLGVPRPLETSYQARVALERHEHHLLSGACGRAKILADPQPLARRWYRYLRRTFNLRL